MEPDNNKSSSQWFLYMIRTCLGTLYTGVTLDVDRRFEEHQSQGKKCAKYLRGKTPLELVHVETLPGKSAAYKLEIKIKKLSKADKERYVERFTNTHKGN